MVVDSEHNIILEEVPIITPNKDIVVGSLSFEVNWIVYAIIFIYLIASFLCMLCFRSLQVCTC